MPSRGLHRKLSKFLLGDDCNATHAAIDYPFRFIGRGHRRLFHDPLSAAIIGYVMDSYKGVASAELHLMADKYLNPRYAKIAEKALSYAAKLRSGTARIRNYKLEK